MQGSYDWALVALSFVVAVMASYSALDLAGRVRASTGIAKRLWLWGGAFAMGTGIWAMHFIGMLAYVMPVRMGYDFTMTAISMAAAVFASALALKIVNVAHLTRLHMASGGLAMGLGICVMHYLGMEAMEMTPPIHYDPTIFSLSVLIAVAASTAALFLAFRLNDKNRRTPIWHRLVAALVMGVGICGMHYTGMAAAEMAPDAVGAGASSMSPTQMSVSIALVAGCIMLSGLVLSIFDAHLASRNAKLASSLQEANDELKSMVLHDTMTRLPNRLLFEEKLSQFLTIAKRQQQPFSVLFVDLDRFKNVNDSLGHHIGDQLIKQAAKRLTAALREDDIVARVGGDEFLVLTPPATDIEQSAGIARRIVDAMASAFEIEGSEIRISSSVGISCYPQNGQDGHELMVHADAAMYNAKASGRNNFQFFEAGMVSKAEQRNHIEKRLRLALDNETLTLAYQPKISAADNSLTGLEALLRWHDDELGIVPPDKVIPLAEDTGLILPLGEWVLRTACKQTLAWHQHGQFTKVPVAVNLSPVQLNQHDFIERVVAILNETGLDPRYLELELTESAVMQNPDRANTILTALRDLGIKISIDDFGTGYSNLAKLKRFPIDRLKIDRSFTAGVTKDAQDAAIVKAVIALAHSLQLDVVAEGVETQDQLEFIRSLQGEQYQGFLCSKALSPADLEAFMQSWKDNSSVLPEIVKEKGA